MRNHEIAQRSDFILRVGLRSKVEKMKRGAERKTHHEVLSIIERQNPSRMFFGKPGLD
jgi:hypothetical protein